MSDKIFALSVPGSVMLTGEHAVLRGKLALVATIDNRLNFVLKFNKTNKVKINCYLGEIAVNLNNLKINKKDWQYILFSIKYFYLKYKINKNFDLVIIDKNLQSACGFGSSAAVVVGVLALLHKAFNKIIIKTQLFKQALAIIHQIQDGLGSGADIAASIYGGIIGIQNYKIKYRLINNFKLTAIYCGYKIKTAEVIKLINKKINNNKKFYNYIFNDIDQYSKLAVIAIKKNNLVLLGNIFNVLHGLMTGLGIVDNNLDYIACSLRKNLNILGAKVSGAGLGDCVIGLGELKQQLLINQQFNLQTTAKGLMWIK